MFNSAHRFGDMPTSRTEYILGRNTRSEYRNCTGKSAAVPPTSMEYEYGPLRAYVRNRDLSYSFELDLTRRLYTATPVNRYESPQWIKPRQMKGPKRSVWTVHMHIETIDTGERREMFGYTARHVFKTTRQTRDSQLLSEDKLDAWYIDSPAAWLNAHPSSRSGIFCITSTTGLRDDFRCTETGQPENGFALLSTRTHRSLFQDETGNSKIHETVYHEEITEFSEAPAPA